MPNLTSALEIGRSALRSHQIGLNVTGNNIANVNTPSYARKSPNLKTAITVAKLGTGVRVASLTRQRDRFLDSQFRFESGGVGEVEALERTMSTIEAVFTELAGGGTTEPGAVFNQSAGAALNGSFSRFFNALQDLANNPESETTRAVVREEAKYLTSQFHRMYDGLTVLRTDMENEFRDSIDEANRLTRQIATLNTRILTLKRDPTDVVGDLEDERDRLIDDLSVLVTVSTREQVDGTVTVQALEGEGILLVDGGQSSDLGTRAVVRGNASVSDLTLAASGRSVDPGSGKLKGLLIGRDEKVISFRDSIDLLAKTVVERTNATHAGGFGLDGSSGTDFFDPVGTTARDIAVSTAILNNLDKIAASSTSTGSGDGSNALALSDLRSELVLSGGTRTLEEFYSDLVGRVGAEAKEVFTRVEGLRLVVEQVKTRRDNVRGVSINEEATQLILFQRAYQAAARIVTLVDELFETALNM